MPVRVAIPPPPLRTREERLAAIEFLWTIAVEGVPTEWTDKQNRHHVVRKPDLREARECLKLALQVGGDLEANMQHGKGCECHTCRRVEDTAEAQIEKHLARVRAG